MRSLKRSVGKNMLIFASGPLRGPHASHADRMRRMRFACIACGPLKGPHVKMGGRFFQTRSVMDRLESTEGFVQEKHFLVVECH